MNTRLDGPGIAGVARAKYPTGQGFWKVTPDAQVSVKRKISKTDISPTSETGEATDAEIRECYYVAKGSWTDCLRAVYNLGRTHGENRVCARLPRLWGVWKCSQRWEGHFWNIETTAECHRLCMSQSDLWTVREYDPRTGGPKPQ